MNKSAITSISIFIFVVVVVLGMWGVSIVTINLLISYTTAVLALIGGIVSAKILTSAESEGPAWLTLSFAGCSLLLFILGGLIFYNLLLL